MESKIVIVHADDFEALYRDGVLQCEGFALEPSIVLASVSVPCERLEVDDEWWEQQGHSFPETLGDVKWRKRR